MIFRKWKLIKSLIKKHIKRISEIYGIRGACDTIEHLQSSYIILNFKNIMVHWLVLTHILLNLKIK